MVDTLGLNGFLANCSPPYWSTKVDPCELTEELSVSSSLCLSNSLRRDRERSAKTKC